MNDSIVLLGRPQDNMVAKITPALQAATGITFAEAGVRAKNCWGYVGERMTEEEARRLADELMKQGLISRVTVPSGIAALPTPEKFSSVEFKTDELLFKTADTSNAFPISDLCLIAAATFKESITKTEKRIEGPSA